jgi:enoyl-CoA hydratase/carnithine racemase
MCREGGDVTPTDILTSREGAVATIEFNRPQRRNALTAEMYAQMAEALREAQADDGVRVVLFRGKPDVFTAGNDIEDFIQRPPVGDDPPVFRFLRAVAHAQKPLVAAVNGPAVGLGTTLLFHCDLVYAGDNARFQMPFTSLGIVPEFASTYLLPLIAGYQRAAELLLLGEPFDAQKALAAGFVTRVLPAGDTFEAAAQAASKLASLPPESIRLTKALIREGHRAAIDNRLQLEGDHLRRMLGKPAAREAMRAFMEKRKPDFSKEK